MAYPSTKFPATARFASSGTVTQPTDQYLLNGFTDEEPIPAAYLNYIALYADATEAILGDLYVSGSIITHWADSADVVDTIEIQSRGGIFLTSEEDPAPGGGSLVKLRAVSGAADAEFGLDSDGGASTAYLSADTWELTAEDYADKVLTWNGSEVYSHKGFTADPDATTDRHYAFENYRSVNINISPRDGGWSYVALVGSGAGNDKQTYVSSLFNLVGESALSGNECSWRRPLHEVEGASRSTSGMWYCESVTANFSQDNSVAFTCELVRVTRSDGTESVLGTITVASGAPGTSSPQTMTINTLLNTQLYTYRFQIVATDSYTSAKRLGQFTANMRKYGAD